MGLLTTDFLKRAAINANAMGDNTIVAGVTGKIIKVYRMFFIVNAAVNIKMRDSAPTDFTGVMNFAVGGALLHDLTQDPWYVCAVGKDFVMNFSAGSQVSGAVYYLQQ